MWKLSKYYQENNIFVILRKYGKKNNISTTLQNKLFGLFLQINLKEWD